MSYVICDFWPYVPKAKREETLIEHAIAFSVVIELLLLLSDGFVGMWIHIPVCPEWIGVRYSILILILLLSDLHCSSVSALVADV